LYGPGFVLNYPQNGKSGLTAVDFSYLNAPADQLTPKRADIYTQKDALPLNSGETVGLRVAVQLKNKHWFSYVPQVVRLSPPYLAWEPEQGTLRLIAGAQPATVKIRANVDNLSVSTKIKLKKL
jgi:hypothetical protein